VRLDVLQAIGTHEQAKAMVEQLPAEGGFDDLA